jgi:hypothetical protein
MLRITRTLTLAALLLPAACSDDGDATTGPDGAPRVFNQIERLGNPLVSEVTLAKRNHGFHNAGQPSTDVASHAPELRSFVRTVAGRNDDVANTIAAVLLPDMLLVQSDKPATTAGWLSWALAGGYGGRRLADDVVDAGLTAIFGPLLDPNNVTAGLTTDNIGENDRPFLTSFPYLAAPHTN